MNESDNGIKRPVAEQNGLPGDGPESGHLPAENAPSENTAAGEAAGGEEGEEVPIVTVTELANTAEGCWKVLSGGERIPLTDQEWRKELARLLARGRFSRPGA